MNRQTSSPAHLTPPERRLSHARRFGSALLLGLSLLLGLAGPAPAQPASEDLDGRYERYRKRVHERGLSALALRRGQERLLRTRRALQTYRRGKNVSALSKEERARIDVLEADFLGARKAYEALLRGETGERYRRLGRETEAELRTLTAELGKRLRSTDTPRLRLLRGALLVDKGHFNLARKDLERVLAAEPKNTEALTYLGRCKEAQGEAEGALANYQRALEIAPSDALRVRTAVALFWLNRFVEARKLRDAVTKLETLPAQVQLDHAWYLAGRQLLEAEKRWQRELTLRHAEAKRGDLPRVALETTRGRIVIELYEDSAPNTVAAFVALIEQGFYKGNPWHRVQPLRLAAAGRPSAPVKGDAEGPGYRTPSELGEQVRHHFRGSVGWLSRDPRGEGGSQFYLVFRPDTDLDGQCAVIGRIVEGLEHAARLRKGDLIDSAKVLRKRKHPYTPKKAPL